MQQIKMDICNSFKMLLTRYKRKVLKLNFKKCEFGKTSINYMEHILSLKGLFPEPEKVDSNLNMKPPSNTSEVHSFLGLVPFCGKFIPNLATITKPMRCQKANFVWNGEQRSAFSIIKTYISKLQYCCIFMHHSKPKLLLMPTSNVWVLFCYKRTLKIVFFNHQLLPVVHYRPQRPDVPKLNEKH